LNKELTLNNKREYDVFVTALNDVKEHFNNSIDISIEEYKGYKDFCDENVDMISKQELLNRINDEIINEEIRLKKYQKQFFKKEKQIESVARLNLFNWFKIFLLK